MNAAVVSAVLLALSVVLGAARLLWPSHPAAARARPWRTALLLIGPAVAALFLYLAMFPPPGGTTPGTLTVISANATDAQLTTIGRQDKVVALPEAPGDVALERVADLATALRRDP
ncbi:MAG TPA: carboxypeptidase regulatory-like domain-containing protein, partial [Myxococcota bacterium]|nr:carboxypeptidase regulatory-like domain-containing protein [Myxococcota bacterium]